MSALETEIARLSHKDVKIRRRAVRHLFEADNPMALKGFVKLLKNKDIWFRNKALDAHRKWANSGSDLLPLMAANQKLVGELLQRIHAPEIAKQLLENDDHIIRSFAAQSLKSFKDLHMEFSLDNHHSVRLVAAQNSIDEEIISRLVLDNHSSVRSAALANASMNEIEISSKRLEEAFSSNDPNLRSVVASMAVERGGEILLRACIDKNPKVRKAISEKLREKIKSVDDRIMEIVDCSPEIVTRWLRKKHDRKSSNLRWEMIENTQIDQRIRSKLIEQMEGKKRIDTSRLEPLFSDESELVKLSAMNLSASVSELKGGRE